MRIVLIIQIFLQVAITKITLFNEFKKRKLLYQFIIKGLLLLLLYLFFYKFLRHIPSIDSYYELSLNMLTTSFLKSSVYLLSMFGYETFIDGTIICYSDNNGCVNLLRGCLGRDSMLLLSGMIVAFPGPIKHKLWYIPLGLVVFYILNTLRISGLLYVVREYPQYLDINHHLVFKYAVYIALFLLWVIWLKKFAINKSK